MDGCSDVQTVLASGCDGRNRPRAAVIQDLSYGPPAGARLRGAIRAGAANRVSPVTTGGVIERAAVGLANQEAMGRWYGPIELARPVWSARHAMHPRASSINCADTFETTRLGGQQRGRMSAESQGQLQSRRHFPSGDLIEQPRQCSFPSAGVDGDLKARKSDDKRERRQFALLIARN